MNIKERVMFWQQSFSNDRCTSKDERLESAKELELVLFAIDKLTDLAPKHDERNALRIRSQATNCMLGDGDFLKMINGEIKP